MSTLVSGFTKGGIRKIAFNGRLLSVVSVRHLFPHSYPALCLWKKSSTYPPIFLTSPSPQSQNNHGTFLPFSFAIYGRTDNSRLIES